MIQTCSKTGAKRKLEEMEEEDDDAAVQNALGEVAKEKLSKAQAKLQGKSKGNRTMYGQRSGSTRAT